VIQWRMNGIVSVSTLKMSLLVHWNARLYCGGGGRKRKYSTNLSSFCMIVWKNYGKTWKIDYLHYILLIYFYFHNVSQLNETNRMICQLPWK